MSVRSLSAAFAASPYAVPEEHRQWIKETAAGDWFVLVHLAFFFLLLSCFGWATWRIWRRTTHPAPHLQLIMEMQNEDDDQAAAEMPRAGGKGTEAPPWERAEDWWKKV